MCAFGSSKSVQNPTPAYTAPAVATPPPPPSAPPIPAAPTPYYVQQAMADAQASQTQANALSRAKVGRAALKIDLVNNTGSTSTSGVNTTN